MKEHKRTQTIRIVLALLALALALPVVVVAARENGLATSSQIWPSINAEKSPPPTLSPSQIEEYDQVVLSISGELKERGLDVGNISGLRMPDIVRRDQWAFAILTLMDPQSGAPMPSDPIYALSRKQDSGDWIVVLPGDSSWNAMLSSAPSLLLPIGFKERYGNVATTSTTASGFNLPWKNEENGTVTTSPTTSYHWNQIDFNLWNGDNRWGSGNIVAIKAGKVKYAKDSSGTKCESKNGVCAQ